MGYIVTNFTPWLGTILLIPSIARHKNIQNDQKYLCSSISGTQFLFITIIFGVGHCTGNVICYFLHGRMRSATILSVFSLVSIALYVLMNVFNSDATLLFILNAVLQLVAAIAVNGIQILATDRQLFWHNYLALSSGMEMATYCLVAALGSVISEVADYDLALKVSLVFAVTGFPAGLSFYRKD